MKKILIILLTLLIGFSVSACKTDEDPNGNPNKSGNLEGSLEEILEQIYDGSNVSDMFKDSMNDGLLTNAITADNMAFHLGTDGIDYEEGIISEPVMSTSAYALCLLRVKDGADIEQIKADIRENVNPFKWVCVGVDEENIVVDNIGDVVILIMSDDEGAALHQGFQALKG